MTVSRRFLSITAAVVIAAGFLAACGDDDDDDSDAGPGGGGSGGGAFPVTVEHEFGSTTIDGEPERIVSVGYTEQDILLALGVTPIAVTEWYGEQPSATWTWARDELGDAKPEVLSLTDGFQYERIVALDPDLIVGVNAGLEQESYDRLSRIAPTVAQPEDAVNFFSPWDAQTLLVGKAIGKEAEATVLVDEVKKQYADAAAAHLDWAGKKIIFSQAPYYDGKVISYQDGLSTDFLTELGFVVPPDIDRYAPVDGSAQAEIPLENLGVLNSAEVLIFATEDDDARPALEAQPVFGTLTPVQQGHLVYTDFDLAGAIYFSTPLSLPYVLDRLVPLLEKAVAGNPETIPAG